MPSGTWPIKINQRASFSGKCDLWISQYELNEQVTIRPSDPFITLGSPAAMTESITIGNFNLEALVVSGASGRGFSWDGFIAPQLVTRGYIVKPADSTKNTVIEGTGIAASFVVGVVAMLYEKWVQEKGMPYANSPLMQSFVLSAVEQFEGKVYPNEGEGYGLLEVGSMDNFFWVPFK